MGDELSCLTELLCCCILLEDYENNQNNSRNNYNNINNPQINHMERNENITIIEGEPLLKNTFKTVKIKRN